MVSRDQVSMANIKNNTLIIYVEMKALFVEFFTNIKTKMDEMLCCCDNIAIQQGGNCQGH